MWYEGESHARYVFLAHLPYPVVSAVAVAFLVGALPFTHFFEQTIKIGCIVQGIFLSVALADKFATRQRDFQHILERTVEKRSAELMSANQVLRKEVRQRRRTEEELRQAKDAAEATTRAKGDFLANMSHEIRTPLNAVLGMIDLMLNSPLSDQQRDRAEVLKAATDALYSLLNDILDFSKIEAGKLDLAETNFSVRNVLTNTESLLAVKAQDKLLHLNCSISDAVPPRLRGDPNRLRQILLNLGNNAIKFTDQGEISVHVDVEEHEDDEVTLRFGVKDTGIGIPGEHLGSVFDRFSQADSSTKRKYGGTGLGLAISSQLAAAMGGRMWAESEPGKGSTFHFTARFRMGEETGEFDPTSTQEIVAAIDLKGMKVLLAEDNMFNQAVALEVLGRQGCEVTVASNGREAVKAFEAHPFDVVLMDLQMPEMDGIEAARAIRAQEVSGRVPIIALTAHAFTEYRDRCLEAGMDEHLSKPIRVSELLTVLARFTSSYKRKASSGDGPADKTPLPDSRPDDSPAIDSEALLERLGGDRQAFQEMVDLFCAHVPALAQDVRAAALAQNWKQLAKLSHTLAGACATFGASALTDVARQIERNAAPPRTLELEELLSRMDLELLALERYVERLRS
jgi:signal transduction histidine kinase/DNA-binding NarL/FixJ family response regulator/HPt (histidine-containing phosphotransfer) domain-containing protein